MPTPDRHDDYDDDFDLDLDLFLVQRAMEEDRAQAEMARRRQADQAAPTTTKED